MIFLGQWTIYLEKPSPLLTLYSNWFETRFLHLLAWFPCPSGLNDDITCLGWSSLRSSNATVTSCWRYNERAWQL